MIKKVYSNYLNSFKGLSKEVWWLALITLINRAGTMVVPFLSLYLTESKGFSLGQVGWIMSAFGLGSVCGSWLGGQLNDRFGSYPTMAFALVSSGILFIVLQYMESFWGIAVAIFFVLLFADIFRPAMFVALRAYSKPENQTRSLTLIRLAINLGFSVGPVLGGFLIYNIGYQSLFWVDGITCFLAVLLMLRVLNPKRTLQREDGKVEAPTSAYRDWLYLFFCFGVMLYAVAFFQFFSTVPLYYREEYGLSEDYIGLLLGFNGLLVFLLEMPIIHAIEKRKGNKMKYINFALFLLLISFLVLNLGTFIFWLWLGIVLMSVAEMLAFPFTNAFAMERAKRGKMGQYMALYSIAFSFAHIFGHNTGLHLINQFGFSSTWWIMMAICILCMAVFAFIGKREKAVPQENL
ncbi:MAG: MFS transporter [Crocinitomicaceae bacterium]